MNAWLSWGIPINIWLQSLGDWLIQPMKFFTFLGTEEFFMLVMPAVLWCFNVGLGFRLALILLASDGLNGSLKLAFGWPRPYWVSSQVRALSTEASFGLPSGHAQTALALWGRLAAGIRRRWATILLGLVIFLISISRLYLGVHFPSDTLVGWLVAGLLLWAFLKWDGPVSQRLGKLSVPGQAAVALVVSLLILGLQLAVFALTVGRAIPPEWAQMATAAAPGAAPIDPRNIEGMFSSAGLLFGIGAGGALLFSWGQFSAGGVWWKRLLRYLLGLIGVVVLWRGLDMVFPEGASVVALALRYLRYAVVGFWAAYLGPKAFVWLRLA